jgi:hypothetical protein
MITLKLVLILPLWLVDMFTVATIVELLLPLPQRHPLLLQRQQPPPKQQQKLPLQALQPQQAPVLVLSAAQHAHKHMPALVRNMPSVSTESGSSNPAPLVSSASSLETVLLPIATMLVVIQRFALLQTLSRHCLCSLWLYQLQRARTLKLLSLLAMPALTLQLSQVSLTFAVPQPRLLAMPGPSPLPLQAVKLLDLAALELSVSPVILLLSRLTARRLLPRVKLFWLTSKVARLETRSLLALIRALSISHSKLFFMLIMICYYYRIAEINLLQNACVMYYHMSLKHILIYIYIYLMGRRVVSSSNLI